nr:hypothetical protein CPGR_00669 [Mycolicibacterium fortuitum subsp. fortuitum DSM 46621 = ATCC 6841 = JCM 6387]
MGVGRHLADLQITERQPGTGTAADLAGHVLPRQRDLDERVMGQGPGRIEAIDEHFERHVLMLIGGQAPGAHLGEQLRHRGIAGEIDPKNQGVHEEADQLVERGVAPPGDRETHCHVGTSAEFAE